MLLLWTATKPLAGTDCWWSCARPGGTPCSGMQLFHLSLVAAGWWVESLLQCLDVPAGGAWTCMMATRRSSCQVQLGACATPLLLLPSSCNGPMGAGVGAVRCCAPQPYRSDVQTLLLALFATVIPCGATNGRLWPQAPLHAAAAAARSKLAAVFPLHTAAVS